MYYPINEKAARIAHNANSMREFVEGSATAEYRKSIDKAAEIASSQKKRVDAIHHDKIDNLLDAYARKLAGWYNKHFAIESRCPSVLITGGGNFPVRKKEKQNSARGQHYETFQSIQGLLDKIKGTGTNGISADDPDALIKLKAKVESLELNHEFMKAANVYYRKHKTLDGCPGLSAGIRADMEFYALKYGRVPTFALSGNLAEIKRLKGRITELERRAEKPLQGWEFDGGEVVANAEGNRLQIFFEGRPDEAQRKELKSRGFCWAPSIGAWQRQLTNNAMFSVKQIEWLKPTL